MLVLNLLASTKGILPRLALICLALFTNWFSVAYVTVIWPVLGWLFMPCTTLAYLLAMVYNDRAIFGGWFVLLVVGVVLDINQMYADCEK